MTLIVFAHYNLWKSFDTDPDSNFHVAHMGPTWVLSATGGPHVSPMNLAIRGSKYTIENACLASVLWQIYLQKCIHQGRFEVPGPLQEKFTSTFYISLKFVAKVPINNEYLLFQENTH